VIDASGVIQFANPAAVALFADRTSRLVGFHFGTPSATEAVEVELPDGERTRYVEMRSRPIRWHGRPAHLASLSDVTRRITTERALRDALARQRALLANAPIGLWALDASGRVTILEGWLLERLDLAPDALLGRRVSDLYEGQPPDVVAITERALRGEVAHARVEVRGRTVEVWYNPITDADGRFAGTIGVGVDVTDQVRLEAQVRQSQKMEAIGRLAGGIAHDFNNQLTAILGYAEMVLEQIDPLKPIWTDLQEIRNAASRSQSLIGQLLAFSRRQRLTPEVVSLDDIVRGLERMLRPLVPEHIVITMRLAAGRWLVRVDRAQVEQILVNLVVNARDAMPGGGRLTISTREEIVDEAGAAAHGSVAPGPFVALAVADTGHGMDAETQARVFEPFFTTKDVGEGTGLGLATVYGIVEQMGGVVSVESERGRGATFTIFFPATEDAQRAVPADAAPDAPAARVGSETILVVEDEDGVRRLATRVLKRHGYRVLAAGSPAEAIERASRAGPMDLVLTDVVMPGMSGPELVRRLNLPAGRVCYMSGYADLEHGDGGHPDAAVLQKPFTANELLRHVRQALDRL
jgi:signal transduction histidine kinase